MTSTFELPAAPTLPPVAPAPADPSMTRLQAFWDAVRHPNNHKQAIRFLCVGGSGYVINNIAFFLLVHAAPAQHTIWFWVASLIGTANNFWWNRNWTFDAKHHHVAKQGSRFLMVSLLVSGLAYGIYLALVGATGINKELANAFAYIIATPFSFIAQKLWSFKA